MRKLLTCILCVCFGLVLSAQTTYGIQTSPIQQELELRRHYQEVFEVPLFTTSRTPSPDFSGVVRNAEFLTLDKGLMVHIRTTQPELLRVPLQHNGKSINLLLYRKDIFSDRYTLRTSAGDSNFKHQPMVFYRGMIEGTAGSVAAVSIVGEEVRVMYSGGEGNCRIHQVDQDQYVLYRDHDITYRPAYTCDVAEEHVLTDSNPGLQQRSVQSGNCVEIYFECDYKSYQDNGSSVSNTEAWVATLFNEVATLYENEEIPVFISDIMVWTSTDPYSSLPTASAMLDEFVDQIDENGYDGRLAHLLSTRGLNSGIAYINVLCSVTLPCGVSTGLSTNITEFPLYSWNVEVVTHELGHNFGSRHTHNCVWNGNSTQIDDCGSLAGDVQSCYDSDEPILPDDGTIMSYCHIAGVGIDFSLGFGPQPGNLIRNRYENATCNTGICTPPECTGITDPESGETLVEVSSNISWASITEADGYRVTIGTSPTNGSIANNVDVGNATTYNPSGNLPFGATIYTKVEPYNIIGNAVGCMNQTFTTEPNSAPQCTQLTFPQDGATDVPVNATLTWEHSVGNQQGYKISIGTTPGGTDILNNFNVGNVNSYAPGSLPSNETVYVRVTPYWQNGDIEGCTVISFSTAGQLYCNSAGQDASEEWIAQVTVGGFTHSSGSQTYSDFTNQIIDVAPGATYAVSITPGFDGQTFPEYFRVWIDFNRDGVFDNPGERVFQSGASHTTVMGTITIPSTALIGTTRMRVSMRWNSYSAPCQVFGYGEVEDYSLRVRCNHVSQTDDTGVGSLPWALGCAAPGETITFAEGLQGDTIELENFSAVISTPVSLVAQPDDDIWIKGVSVQNAFRVESGVEATISGIHIIAGIANEGSGILNQGTLTLENVQILRHPGLPTGMTLKNTGTLYMSGACQIE
jgi:hypothetical protein